MLVIQILHVFICEELFTRLGYEQISIATAFWLLYACTLARGMSGNLNFHPRYRFTLTDRGSRPPSLLTRRALMMQRSLVTSLVIRISFRKRGEGLSIRSTGSCSTVLPKASMHGLARNLTVHEMSATNGLFLIRLARVHSCKSWFGSWV